MKLYTKKIDSCTGSKIFSILEFKNSRSLFGIYYDHLSIFYRKFESNYHLANTAIVEASTISCDSEKLTRQKIENLLNEDLTFLEKIKFFKNFNYLNKLNKSREKFIDKNLYRNIEYNG